MIRPIDTETGLEVDESVFVEMVLNKHSNLIINWFFSKIMQHPKYCNVLLDLLERAKKEPR